MARRRCCPYGRPQRPHGTELHGSRHDEKLLLNRNVDSQCMDHRRRNTLSHRLIHKMLDASVRSPSTDRIASPSTISRQACRPSLPQPHRRHLKHLGSLALTRRDERPNAPTSPPTRATRARRHTHRPQSPTRPAPTSVRPDRATRKWRLRPWRWGRQH